MKHQDIVVMRASLWEYGDFPYQTDLVDFPVGMDLYPIEPLNGIVAFSSALGQCALAL